MTDHDPTATVPEQPEPAAETVADTPEAAAPQPANGQPAPAAAADSAAIKAAQEYLAGWQRERAEFANYKKRVEREMSDLSQNAAADSFRSLLPALDDLELAMSNIPADLQAHPWLNGLTAVHRKFLKALGEAGISLIDPTGQPFDPARHEAVSMEDSDTVESGHVTTTLRKGYAHGERVLRTALVRVAN